MTDLLPLPVPTGLLYLHSEQSVQQVHGFTAKQTQAYARANVEHDRAGRGGLDAYALSMFVACGFLTQAKVDEARAVASRLFDAAAPAAQPAGVSEVGAIAANLRGLIASTMGRPFTASERVSLQILSADLTLAAVRS